MILTANEQHIVEIFSFAHADTKFLSSLMPGIEFPESAILLWTGCIRKSEWYDFPAGLRAKWKQSRAGGLDRRMSNGPPNSAFALGHGRKPSGWELDHIYDEEPLWSVTDGMHFTQSAGLAAMHKHVHRLRHADGELTWLVRGIAFARFGYDPLRTFSTGAHDCFGFVAGRSCEVFWPEPPAGGVKT
jgi:hypothetical protein